MSWTLITQLRGMQERECASLGDMADQTAGRAADALEREMQRAEAAEARVKELEAQLNKRIDAYMNEPHCCSGRECGCMGVTRFEQIVGEELGQRMATMREKNARLRGTLMRVTGSLGLVLKGAGIAAPAHKENYHAAKKLIEETFSGDREEAST